MVADAPPAAGRLLVQRAISEAVLEAAVRVQDDLGRRLVDVQPVMAGQRRRCRRSGEQQSGSKGDGAHGPSCTIANVSATDRLCDSRRRACLASWLCWTGCFER